MLCLLLSLNPLPTQGYCPPQASTPAQPQVAAPAPRTPAPTDRPAPSPAFSPSSASQRTPHLPQASLASADTSLPVQRTVASTHEPPAWTATSANNNSRFRASPSSPSIGSSPHSLASGPSHAQPVFVERTQPILRSQSDMHFDRQRPRSVQFHPATMPTATTAPAPDDLLALQPTRARGAPPSVSSSLLAAPLEPDLTSSRRHSWSTWGGGARTDSYTPHLHGRHPEPSPVEDELDQLLADFRSALVFACAFLLAPNALTPYLFPCTHPPPSLRSKQSLLAACAGQSAAAAAVRGGAGA